MRGRLRHGRGYSLRGRDASLALEPGATPGYRREDSTLILTLPRELVIEIEAALRDGLVGHYRFDAWPELEVVVTPSVIRDQDGKAVEVRGVADAREAARLIAEENARLADADEGDADEGDDDDDHDHDHDHDHEPDEDAVPPPSAAVAALAMSERALRLASDDEDIQFTHAMLLLDAERAGVAGQSEALLALLPAFAPAVRLNVATRMASHRRFAEAVDLALRGDAAGFAEVPHELFTELGEAILERVPEQLTRLAPLLPGDVNLLSELAWKATQAEHPEQATALYERLLQQPIPGETDDRTSYLRALNNACVQAHAAKAYDLAGRIADRAQPVAHENPYIYHSAACAYAALGDYAKAFQQVKLAVEHEYDHLGKVEVDRDLGPILDWPEFKALFRDWHARQEGN
jgi:tetratricopeptide (TPR) repeat protein